MILKIMIFFSFKVPMKQNFFIILFERAFRTIKMANKLAKKFCFIGTLTNISFWTVLSSFFLDRLVSFQEDAKKFVALAKKINSEKICSQVKTSWLQLYCSFM